MASQLAAAPKDDSRSSHEQARRTTMYMLVIPSIDAMPHADTLAMKPAIIWNQEKDDSSCRETLSQHP
eukprot:4916325-Amphidinium_carterae.1